MDSARVQVRERPGTLSDRRVIWRLSGVGTTVRRRQLLPLIGASLLPGCGRPRESGDLQGSTDAQETGATRSPAPDHRVTGELRTWHEVAVIVDGPHASETGSENPFADVRMTVDFRSPTGQEYSVPGHFAADAMAADSGARSGSTWRAYLMPDAPGVWSYQVTLVRGTDAALGEPAPTAQGHGVAGTFTVKPSTAPGDSFLGRGRLDHRGGPYLTFVGSDEPFLKNGAGGPENFLAYEGFDGTPPSHRFESHEDDWRPGDPLWGKGRGREIVGAINYLSSMGVNALYLVTYNADGGDGDDVWPWVDRQTKRRYDVSKLDQWNTVFGHMSRRGVMPHLLFRETENDRTIEGGDVGPVTELYYREFVSRFGHHPAITWNLGEETNLSTDQVLAHARTLRDLDPYDHPIVVHNRVNGQESLFGPLLGEETFAGPSLQTDVDYQVHERVTRWRRRSAEAGHQWAVMVDETGPGFIGVPCDGEEIEDVSQAFVRKTSLWPGYLAGAAGLSWYPGLDTCAGDLTLEDFRSRENWWGWTRIAHDIVVELPVEQMAPRDDLIRGRQGHHLRGGGVSLTYLPTAGRFEGKLPDRSFEARWISPTSGEVLDRSRVQGDGWTPIEPPRSGDDVALVLDDDGGRTDDES